MIVLFCAGFWWIAGLIPPPAPSWSATEITRFYLENRTRIRLGLVISMLAAALVFPFTVAIMLQIRRIEGHMSPLAYSQLGAGWTTPLLLALPMFAMGAAAYRPDRTDPEITQALNDLGWLPLVGFAGPAVLQAIVIGVAILRDHRERPVLPRWVGYYNLWCAIGFTAGALVICFWDGPFAWNGIIAFWLALTIFGTWFVVMGAVLHRAINEQERDEVGGSPLGQRQTASTPEPQATCVVERMG